MNVESSQISNVERVDADEVRRRAAWLRRRRWWDFAITAGWASAMVGVTVWRDGVDAFSQGLAAFVAIAFGIVAVVLFTRGRRELAAARASEDAMRAHVRAELDARLNGFLRTTTLRRVLKVLGVLIVVVGVGIVAKERMLGNGWAGIPDLASAVVWASMLVVWPTIEERWVVPQLEHARTGLGD